MIAYALIRSAIPMALLFLVPLVAPFVLRDASSRHPRGRRGLMTDLVIRFVAPALICSGLSVLVILYKSASLDVAGIIAAGAPILLGAAFNALPVQKNATERVLTALNSKKGSPVANQYK